MRLGAGQEPKTNDGILSKSIDTGVEGGGDSRNFRRLITRLSAGAPRSKTPSESAPS
jgi:hypothetical protein